MKSGFLAGILIFGLCLFSGAAMNPARAEVTIGSTLNVSRVNGEAGDPVHAGAISDDGITALDFPYDIHVSGKYAYVASFGDDGVEILDVSDPANPVHAGAITDDSSRALSGASDVFVSGKYAYVTAGNENSLAILDVSDPAHPVYVGDITDDSTTVLKNPGSLFVSGKYAYVTSYGESGVEVLDVSGVDLPAASLGSLSAGTADVSENARVGNDLVVGGAFNVGAGGIQSEGPVSISDVLSLTPKASAPPNPAEGDIYFGKDGDLHLYSSGGWHRLQMEAE